MKFAICNEMFEGWAFEDVCGAAAGAGYAGIEIAPYTLGKPISEVTYSERAAMRDAAVRHGLEIAGLHWLLAKTEGFHINHPQKSVRDRTAAYLTELIHLCADLGGHIMVFGSPMQRNLVDGATYQQAWDHAAEAFRSAAPVLEERGVVLCFEPLGPQETGFINTAAEAARMVREVGSDSFQLLLDVKAMSTEAEPIPEIIRANREIVRHFHANDANRRGPGFGDTDFVPIAAALKEIDYRGWISVEVFDFSPDPVTIATNSMAYLQRCFG